MWTNDGKTKPPDWSWNQQPSLSVFKTASETRQHHSRIGYPLAVNVKMLAQVFFAALFVCSLQAQPLQKPVAEPAKTPVEVVVPIVQKAAEIVQKDAPIVLELEVEEEIIPEPSIEPVGPIELRRRHHGGHHGGGGGGSSNKALQQMVDQMWKADHDKPHMKLDWGSKMQANSRQNPLVKSVDESIFNRPQYQTLIRMFNANLFTPDVCKAEAAMSGQKKALVKDVFDAFTKTPMFKIAYDYLRQKGAAKDLQSFETKVWNLWMGTYSRCHHGVHGSSGWEHVFVGEWKGHEIDGQHDWVRYYMLQQQNKMVYHGYKEHDGDLIGSFSYSWENHLKKLGGFYLGTSPAFDFSLFTVCALSAPGSGKCTFNIEQYQHLGVVSYTQSCDDGLCLATAYPVE